MFSLSFGMNPDAVAEMSDQIAQSQLQPELEQINQNFIYIPTEGLKELDSRIRYIPQLEKQRRFVTRDQVEEFATEAISDERNTKFLKEARHIDPVDKSESERILREARSALNKQLVDTGYELDDLSVGSFVTVGSGEGKNGKEVANLVIGAAKDIAGREYILIYPISNPGLRYDFVGEKKGEKYESFIKAIPLDKLFEPGGKQITEKTTSEELDSGDYATHYWTVTYPIRQL